MDPEIRRIFNTGVVANVVATAETARTALLKSAGRRTGAGAASPDYLENDSFFEGDSRISDRKEEARVMKPQLRRC